MSSPLQPLIINLKGLEDALIGAITTHDPRKLDPAIEGKIDTLLKNTLSALGGFKENLAPLKVQAQGLTTLERIIRVSALMRLASSQQGSKLKHLEESSIVVMANRIVPSESFQDAIQMVMRLRCSYDSLKTSESKPSRLRVSGITSELEPLCSKLLTLDDKYIQQYVIAFSLKEAAQQLNEDATILKKLNHDSKALIGGKSAKSVMSAIPAIYDMASLSLMMDQQPLSDTVSDAKKTIDSAFDASQFPGGKPLKILLAQQESLRKGDIEYSRGLINAVKKRLALAGGVQHEPTKKRVSSWIAKEFAECLVQLPYVYPGHIQHVADQLIAECNEVLILSEDDRTILNQAMAVVSDFKPSLTDEGSLKMKHDFELELAELTLASITGGENTPAEFNTQIESAVNYFNGRYPASSDRPRIINTLLSLVEKLEQTADADQRPVTETQKEQPLSASGFYTELPETVDENSTPDVVTHTEPQPSTEYQDFDDVNESAFDNLEAHNETGSTDSHAELDEIVQHADSLLSDNNHEDLMNRLMRAESARALAEEQLKSQRRLLADMPSDEACKTVQSRIEKLRSLYEGFLTNKDASLGAAAEIVSMETDIGYTLYKNTNLILSAITPMISDVSQLHADALNTTSFARHMEHGELRERFESGIKLCDFAHSSSMGISPFDLYESRYELNKRGPSYSLIRSIVATIQEQSSSPQTPRPYDETQSHRQAAVVRQHLLSESVNLLKRSVELCRDAPAVNSTGISHAISHLMKNVNEDVKLDDICLRDKLDQIRTDFVQNTAATERPNVVAMASASPK